MGSTSRNIMTPDDSRREFDSVGRTLVLLAFSSNFLWGCILKNLAVILPTLTDQFTTDAWVIGTVASLMTVASDITGLFAAPLEHVLGSRRVVSFSTVALCLGLLAVPFATRLLHIAASVVFLVGGSIGILGVVSRALLAKHFHRHYTLACGIGHSGNAVSLLVFTPIMQLFLDTYGWRGATLMTAGICFHALPVAVLVREADEKPTYQPLPSSHEHQEADGKSSLLELCRRVYKSTNLVILTEFNFVMLYACRFGLTITYLSWMVYFVPHLVAKGFAPQVASTLSSAAAVGYFFGTFIWAPLIDRGLVKCTSGIIVSSLALSVTYVVDPWLNDVPLVATITFVLGMSLSAVYTLLDVWVKDLFDRERLMSAFGWIRAFGFLPRLVAGLFPGWIYDTRGSYDVAFVVFGFSPAVSLLPMVFGHLWRRH